MRPTIKYYFTTYGEVYAGFEMIEMGFPQVKVIVQADKLFEYTKLNHSEKTLEKIKEYAHLIPLAAYMGEIDGDKIAQRQRIRPEYWWQEEHDRKNMFVFGAGASAYCVTGNRTAEFKNDVLRPPLGNELFGSRFKRLYEKYEGVKQSLFDLQHDEVNVEEYLESEWNEVSVNGNSTLMSKHINIQFYLQELLMAISKRVTTEYYDFNLYAKLADKLQKINGRESKMHFAFVSFNQDTLLEHFLSSYFKRPLSSFDSYVEVNDSPICIFKPHGSWNWGWAFPKKVTNLPKALFDENIDFYKLYYELLGDPITMVDWNSWGRELSLNENRKGKLTVNKSRLSQFDQNDLGSFYPAMLLPYRDKDEFTMPPIHYDRLVNYLPYVENLFIIGWKGNEMLFNKILREKTNRIKRVIIADPNSKTVEENLRGLLARPGIEKVVYRDFEDFVRNGIDKELH